MSNQKHFNLWDNFAPLILWETTQKCTLFIIILIDMNTNVGGLDNSTTTWMMT